MLLSVLFPSSCDIKTSPPLCPLCSTRSRQREEGAPAENQSFSSSTRNAVNEMTAPLDFFFFLLTLDAQLKTQTHVCFHL